LSNFQKEKYFKKKLFKGDLVVMFGCGEADFFKGKVWTCRDDEFISSSGERVVFLENFSGTFLVNCLRKKTKEERVLIVNQIIREIASKSHRSFFFEDENRFAEMILDKGKVYFLDDYTNKKVYAYNNSSQNGFSHGGTFWGLINDFREFIQTGKRSNGSNGYGGLYCTHWGYPEEDMIKIREVATELGYLKENSLVNV
jgi:hypothetical protein